MTHEPNAPSRLQCFGLGAAGGITSAAVFVVLVSAVLYLISNIQQRLDDERNRR